MFRALARSLRSQRQLLEQTQEGPGREHRGLGWGRAGSAIAGFEHVDDANNEPLLRLG